MYYNIYPQNLFKLFFKITIFFLFLFDTYAGGIRGSIRNEKNEVMPFASVFDKSSSVGSLANEEGKFELNLSNGKHEIIFQFIGYQSVIRQIEVNDSFIELEIVMKETFIQLGEAKVKSNNEDPALSIMRKTIAMSAYHHKEIEKYSLRSYLRGTFRLDDVPFFLEGQMKKNFIKKGQTYVFESVNEIKFKQPNSITEKVLSIRSNFPPTMKSNENGISFSQIDFYNPQDDKSPVTIKGAANYRYSYLGFFEDKGLTINKIRVIPKVKAPEYFSGVMNIVDGVWYIHSVDFNVEEEVGKSNLKIIFSAIEDVWMPVQLDMTSAINMVGVDLNLRFVASFKNYQITKNPKYASIKPEVLDDKIFKSEAKTLDKQKIDRKTISLQKELTTKQLKSAMKQLQKEEIKEKIDKKEEIITQERNRSIDSLASKRSDDFWNNERQIPLTTLEIKSYKQADSMYKVDEKKILTKIKTDSINRAKPKNKFKFSHLVFGHSYSFGFIDPNNKSKGQRNTFTIGNWVENTRYNAVEGINIGIPRLNFNHKIDSIRSLGLGIKPQYSINRNRLNGSLSASYQQKSFGLGFDAGRQVYQVNSDKPMSNLLNAAFAIIDGRHYAKFYEQSYLRINYAPRIGTKFNLFTSIQIAERSPLENIVSQGLRKDRLYEPNELFNIEKNYPFETHLQTKFTANLTFRPFTKTTIFNGRKFTAQYGPFFRLTNTSAFGDASFNRIEASVTHQLKWGMKDVYFRAEVGSFYGKKPSYFLDFKHFNGNLLFVQPHNEFRDLPYYQFSTNRSYADLFGKIDFKRLFITQIPYFQKKSVSENLFVNFLTNQHINHLELGYGIKALGGGLRGDVYTIFQNGVYSHTGFRVYLPFRNLRIGNAF
jgi:hypothetical protein